MAKRPDNNVTEETNTPVSTNTSMPSYLSAAARLSTSRPLGAPSTDDHLVDWTGNGLEATLVDTDAVAGIYVLDYMPTFGVSRDANSALNRAAFTDFNTVRSQISGTRPYQAVDMMLARMCIDSLRDLYLYMTRIYTIISRYSATNLYRPVAILTAMGLNAREWIRDAANLYQWLLSHQGALAPFPTVPIGRITARHNLYNMALFTDGEPDCSQTYIINQKYFYSYEHVDEVKGVKLVQPGSTPTSFYDTWDRLYAALQGSDDIYIIAADIRRAFGDKVITNLPAPNAAEVVQYVKMDPVLTSIMNSVSTAFVSTGTSGIMMHDTSDRIAESLKIHDGGGPGLLMCDPKFRTDLNTSDSAIDFYPAQIGHLNFVETDPSADAVLNAVRFRPAYDWVRITRTAEDNTTFDMQISSMGTEVILTSRMYKLRHDGSLGSTTIGTVIDDRNEYGLASLAAVIISEKSVFDWAPLNFYVSTDSVGGRVRARVEDVQNYVPITTEQLKYIHEANLLAEFGVE